MNMVLARNLLVIIEAGIEVLAQRINKRRQIDGRNHRPTGRGAHSSPVGHRRAVNKRRRRRRSISKR